MRGTTRVVLLVAAASLATAKAADAQRVVPVDEEPRHRRVFVSDDLFVLDVQIAPGDTTLFHTHSTPITYVTLGTSSTDARSLGGEWNGTVPRDPPPGRIGAVRAVIGYAESPLTHQVTNVGHTLFRLLAIAQRGRGNPDAAAAAPGEVQGQPNRWFRYTRWTSGMDGDRTFAPTVPTVAVLISEDRVAFAYGSGWRTSLDQPGDIAVLEPGREVTILDQGSNAEVVFVEVR